jgi:Fibronectin type III domain
MQAPVLLDADTAALTVQWAPQPGAAVYEVQLAIVSDSDPEWSTLSSTLQSTVLRKKNLQPDSQYLFRVRSKKGEWIPFSPASAPLSTLPASVSRMPEAPVRSDATSDAVTVTWKPVEGCSAYELQMAEAAAEGEELVWTTLSSAIKAPVAKKKSQLFIDFVTKYMVS